VMMFLVQKVVDSPCATSGAKQGIGEEDSLDATRKLFRVVINDIIIRFLKVSTDQVVWMTMYMQKC